MCFVREILLNVIKTNQTIENNSNSIFKNINFKLRKCQLKYSLSFSHLWRYTRVRKGFLFLIFVIYKINLKNPYLKRTSFKFTST